MFDDPLSLQGVHSSNFHSKMQKITVLVCPLAKNSTASQKNCTDVFAPSARFYNFAHDYWSTDDINDENEGTEILVIALFVSKKCPCQCLIVSSCKRQSSCDSWCSHAPSWVALSAVAKCPPPSWHRRPYLAVLSLSTPQRCSLFCPLDTRLPATCPPDLHSPGVLPNGA